jgi:hypothetical protein
LRSAYYELAFRNRYVESTGESFQELFSTLMELRYPGDFARVRPWGKAGDRKNDGYLRSHRRLFQCFAPKEMKPLSKWLTKIEEDFTGALPYWKAHFDQWVFVHNDPTGLPPDVLKLLLDLTNQHQPVTAAHWGYHELLGEFKALSPTNVASLLGPAPAMEDMVEVRVQDVMYLLDHIALQPEPMTSEVKPVPATKLHYNQLSDAAALLLKAGMTRSEIVRKYLRGLSDQTRYDRVAAAFRQRYQELRSEGRAPDDILAMLQKFIAGSTVPSPAHQAATLAILAFFFEACEIFERPPGEEAPAA